VVSFAPRDGLAQDPFEKVEREYYGVLSFPRGVRSFGMGLTGTADAADPANVYYNPSVLAYGPEIGIVGGTNNWMSGFDVSDVGVSATYRSLSESHPRWHVGAGVRYVVMDFDGSTPTPQDSLYSWPTPQSFKDWYLGSTVAGGYKVGSFDLAAGFTVKYVDIASGSPDGVNTWTYDVGALAQYTYARNDGVFLNWSFGVSGLSLGGQKDEGAQIIDPAEQVRYGVGLRIEAVGLQESGEPISRDKSVISLTIDGELIDYVGTDLEPGSGVGFEMMMVNIMSIRYGYADKQYAFGPGQTFGYGQTFGGGLGYGWSRWWFRLDFAMTFETNLEKNISAVGMLIDVDI